MIILSRVRVVDYCILSHGVINTITNFKVGGSLINYHFSLNVFAIKKKITSTEHIVAQNYTQMLQHVCVNWTTQTGSPKQIS